MDGGGLKPANGKVYFRMFEIVQRTDKVAELSTEDRDAVKLCVSDRWNMLHTDMHSAGFILDLEYNFEAYEQGTNFNFNFLPYRRWSEMNKLK